MRRLVKPLAIILTVSAVLCGLTLYLARTVVSLDYFCVKDIITDTDEAVDLAYLKGRPIFSLDLQKEARYISEAYPLYKRVRLVRVLPNRLFASFAKRAPVAAIKLYKYFYVDEEAVLFNPASGELPPYDLPVILGLETKIFGPKPGRRYNVKELALALNIIKLAGADKILKAHRIARIEVAGAKGASFFIGELEVRVGEEDIKEKLGLLAGLLVQMKRDLAGIGYIDLRFKEPVIKLKDARRDNKA